MNLWVYGMSFKSAALPLRERFAVADSDHLQLLTELLDEEVLAEAMVVSTCNRVEVYCVPTADATTDAIKQALERQLLTQRGIPVGLFHDNGYVLRGQPAVEHIMRVTSSLDSMVVGEPQILGQVKAAMRLARDANAIGPLLGRVTDRALRAAKAVRTRTDIGRESVSIGSVAVDLARRIFDDISDVRVLIVGAGKMAEATARALVDVGVARVYCANRDLSRASALADRHGWLARSLSELEDLMTTVDVVISSTGSNRPLITRAVLSEVIKKRKYRPLFIVDIAVPRDVEESVGQLDTVYLYNIDDLQGICSDNLAERQGEINAAQLIVNEELDALEKWHRGLGIKPTVTALREHVHGVLSAELERTLNKRFKDLDEAQRASLDKMVDAMTSKLLHPAMRALSEGAERGDGEQVMDTVQELFGLDNEQS